MKYGVVRFPGSCDERDALLAAGRSARRSCCGTRDADLKGVDAVIVPGGFSYGDYLRVGAIARFSPVMGEVERFAARRRARARDLQRLPGAVRGRPAAGRAAPEHLAALRLPPGRRRGRQRSIAVDARLRGGRRLSIPAKHTTGRYWAPDEVLDELEPNGQVILRYAAGHNFNGSARDIAGVSNPAGNVLGLMPHPEHAVDALTGSVDGLSLLSGAPA